MRNTFMGTTAVLVVAAASACADQAPTAPAARTTLPVATAAPPVVTSPSTICVGYAHRRVVSEMRLEAAQEHHASQAVIQKLSDEVEHLDAISRDACN